ncbi:hypothetical protein BAE44_0026244 [Dichanthelium oligosanthes]|uniref:Uncharacterized protein n=1 Tax=Dichanthelium oligosanthes TaxID=888268 RepID=A0A1E5UIP2_9POAL|nr:hypothetical protein BAE44_0026244 [Dichanthelium oligosanthes]
MNGKIQKAKKNKKMDPLVATDATYAQGWLVKGGDGDTDVEPVAGLTWKLIEEACSTEEITKLCRSARLSQMRNVDEDFSSEPEEEPVNEFDKDIEFESAQEDVGPIARGGDELEGGMMISSFHLIINSSYVLHGWLLVASFISMIYLRKV